MSDCIFCKIVKGEIGSAKVWEDNEFLAILDVNPNTKGQTLILAKQHHPSYLFDLPEDLCQKFIVAAKKVAKILEKGLEVKRVGMVMEGMGVNHSHIKLYPLYGIEERKGEMPEDRIFFEKYEGHITTQLGPQADFEELKKLAKEIRKGA